MAVYTFFYGLVFTIGVCVLVDSVDTYKAPFENASISLTLSGPDDVVVARNQPASFSCTAKSNSVVSIRWLFNGNAILLNDSRFLVHDNGTLTVPRVAGRKVGGGTLEGAYQCYLKNDYGALLSNPARLQLAALGRDFSEQMQDVTVQEGQPVVLPCRIHSFPRAAVAWVRDEQLLPQTTRYVPLPLGSLLITNTHSSDTGSYSCNVTNPILKNKAKESRKGQLTVVDNARKPASPHLLDLGINLNVTVLLGEDVRLFCAAAGWPPPSIKWLKGNKVLLANSTVFTVRNVTTNEAGRYSCLVQNGFGSNSQTYNIEIHQPPYFNHTLQSKTYASPVTLRTPCHAFGTPKPRVHWLVNGTEFNFTADRRYFNNSQLYIFKSLTTDAGIYQCVAENAAGRSWIAVQYYSKNPPGSALPAPVNMRCEPYNDTSVCIRWDVPPNVEPSAFTVDSYHGEMGPDYLSNVTYVLASGLRPNEEYSFVARLYVNSASDNSSAVKCRTGIIGERNLRVYLHDYNSVNLTWLPISSDYPCDLSTVQYRLQWRQLGANFSSVRYINDRNSTVVSGLNAGVTYEFRIASITTKLAHCRWVSFAFPVVQNSTVSAGDDVGHPGTAAVFDLHVKVQRSNAIELKWSYSDENVAYFHVCYFEAYSDRTCDSTEGIKNETTLYDGITIKNLKSSVTYEFNVRTVRRDKSFGNSRIIESHTLAEGPVIIYDLKYRIVNSTTVCVRWRAPYHKNGKYIKYTVRYSSQDGAENSVNVTASLAKNKTPCWIDQSGTVLSVLLVQLNPDDLYKLLIEPEQNSDVTAAPPIYLSTNQKHSTEKIGSAKDDVEYDQKLGIAVGMSISLCAFVACTICLVRMVVKKRKTRTTNRNRTRFYVCEMRTQSDQLGATEVQEMQNLLVTGNGTGNIPALPSTDLDSKGSADYPNKYMNGNVHLPNENAATANGHIHILENPQCCHFDHMCPGNGHANGLKTFEEDSNSNLSGSNLHTKILSHFGANRNSKTLSVESLNTTQLTYLDDAEVVQTSLRKVSSPLGPNG